jgi:hypothetical protein
MNGSPSWSHSFDADGPAVSTLSGQSYVFRNGKPTPAVARYLAYLPITGDWTSTPPQVAGLVLTGYPRQ